MDRSGRAAATVALASARLTGQTAAGARVSTVFWYGAVDIDPLHLVVWVLLDGRQPEELPRWLLDDGADQRLDPALLDACVTWRHEIRDLFAQADWPDPNGVRVGFDSEQRVSDGGGWNYFR